MCLGQFNQISISFQLWLLNWTIHRHQIWSAFDSSCTFFFHFCFLSHLFPSFFLYIFFFHILWKWNCYWSLAEKAIKWADGLGDGGMGSGEVNEIRRSDPSGSSFTGLGWPGASSPSGPSASFTTSSGIHLSRVIIQRYLFYGRFWRICGHLRG